MHMWTCGCLLLFSLQSSFCMQSARARVAWLDGFFVFLLYSWSDIYIAGEIMQKAWICTILTLKNP